MAEKANDIAQERANAAQSILDDLQRHGVPKKIAHDLLNGYTQAIEGYHREEWGARKVMIAAGVLPGSLNRYMEAKRAEVLKRIDGGIAGTSGHYEQADQDNHNHSLPPSKSNSPKEVESEE